LLELLPVFSHQMTTPFGPHLSTPGTANRGPDGVPVELNDRDDQEYECDEKQ